MRLPKEQLAVLPRAISGTYYLWIHGQDVRSMMSKSTYHRHRRELLAVGIDIARPFVDEVADEQFVQDDGRVSVYLVRIHADQIPGMQNFATHEHDETYLGKDCRVASMANGAHLATAEDAEAFAVARRDHMRKLYGPGTQTVAVSVRMPRGTDRQHRALLERIRIDTARVRARLRSGQFAPNVAPASIADEAG